MTDTHNIEPIQSTLDSLGQGDPIAPKNIAGMAGIEAEQHASTDDADGGFAGIDGDDVCKAAPLEGGGGQSACDAFAAEPGQDAPNAEDVTDAAEPNERSVGPSLAGAVAVQASAIMAAGDDVYLAEDMEVMVAAEAVRRAAARNKAALERRLGPPVKAEPGYLEARFVDGLMTKMFRTLPSVTRKRDRNIIVAFSENLIRLISDGERKTWVESPVAVALPHGKPMAIEASQYLLSTFMRLSSQTVIFRYRAGADVFQLLMDPSKDGHFRTYLTFPCRPITAPVLVHEVASPTITARADSEGLRDVVRFMAAIVPPRSADSCENVALVGSRLQARLGQTAWVAEIKEPIDFDLQLDGTDVAPLRRALSQMAKGRFEDYGDQKVFRDAHFGIELTQKVEPFADLHEGLKREVVTGAVLVGEEARKWIWNVCFLVYVSSPRRPLFRFSRDPDMLTAHSVGMRDRNLRGWAKLQEAVEAQRSDGEPKPDQELAASVALMVDCTSLPYVLPQAAEASALEVAMLAGRNGVAELLRFAWERETARYQFVAAGVFG